MERNGFNRSNNDGAGTSNGGKREHSFSSSSSFGGEQKTKMDANEERIHFEKIVNAFKSYKKYYTGILNKKRRYLSSLNDDYQARLKSYRISLGRLQDCIDENTLVLNKIVDNASGMFE